MRKIAAFCLVAVFAACSDSPTSLQPPMPTVAANVTIDRYPPTMWRGWAGTSYVQCLGETISIDGFGVSHWLQLMPGNNPNQVYMGVYQSTGHYVGTGLTTGNRYVGKVQYLETLVEPGPDVSFWAQQSFKEYITWHGKAGISFTTVFFEHFTIINGENVAAVSHIDTHC